MAPFLGPELCGGCGFQRWMVRRTGVEKKGLDAQRAARLLGPLAVFQGGREGGS